MILSVRRVVAGAIALALMTTMAMVTAGSAAADDPSHIAWDHTWHEEGVAVYVLEHGDIIWVCDTARNGKSAHVKIEYPGVTTRGYSMTASGGVNTCTDHRASDGGEYDIPEGAHVEVTCWGVDYKFLVTNFTNDH